VGKKQGPPNPVRQGAKALLQRTSFVLELNADLEIGNHAAAGALAFLLSAVPALLLSFGITGALLQAFPQETKEFQTWIARFLGPINLPDATPKIFGQGFFALGTLAAVAGLLYSSRFFFSSIRKTLKVIWGNPESAPTWLDTISGFFLELGSLVVLVTVLALSESARTLVYANQDELAPGVFWGVAVFVEAVPMLVLVGFFVVTLRIFPLKRPGWSHTIGYSLVAVVLFGVVNQILRVAINTDQYEVLYGVIANLVVVLLNVSVFFTLYFLTAAFLFVEQNIDALVFGRYYRHWGAEPPFPDNLLFRNPQRLRQLFERKFGPGERLFEQGAPGRAAFFLESGEVEIVLEDRVLDVLQPGQIFGETASILGEPRSAGARARGEVTVFELPPEVFGFYLRSDRSASKRLIGTLAERLKRANSQQRP